MKSWKTMAAAGLMALSSCLPVQAVPIYQEVPPQATLVARSEQPWEGVAVLPSGRVFVCYPDSNNRPAYSVAEIAGKTVRPYFEQTAFNSVQSMTTDSNGCLWLLDAGCARGSQGNGAAPRICLANPDADTVETIYEVPAEALLSDSFLDDLRVDLEAGCVYITDSGHGGILVLDLASGEAWRALTDIPEVRANLQTIYFLKTGVYNTLAHCDGLELSKNKQELYFCALGSDCLYKIPTAVLRDRTKSVADRQKAIELMTLHSVPTDGMVLRDDILYMGDLADEAVWAFDIYDPNKKDAGRILAELQKDFRWPASFALAPDKSVYFTTTAANYPPNQRAPYELYRMVWSKNKEVVDYE